MTTRELQEIKEILEDNYSERLAEDIVNCILYNMEVVPDPLEYDFINDSEKMFDFFILSKDDFLNSYSYLDEREYIATLLKLTSIIKEV